MGGATARGSRSCSRRTLTGPKAYLDHLVVAPEWRRGASRIDLTAADSKQAGHALYASVGFRERDTRSFRRPL